MKRDLTRLLNPKSIAVIGGGAWCEQVVHQSEAIGFDGEIWPVHPHRKAIGDRRAYANVASLPGAPDAAFVGINRHLTVENVRQLSASARAARSVLPVDSPKQGRKIHQPSTCRRT